MKKIFIPLCVVGLLNSSNSFSMEDERALRVYAIPGQNGLGSEPWYIESSTGIHHSQIQQVTTPKAWLSIDLGQGSCMQELDQALQHTTDEFIMHATSQGTATAINYLAQHPAQQNKLKALILEATLGSGNSAICHTVTGGLKWLKSIPFHYYWLPYLAKTVFPSYSPWGKQAIKSIGNIRTTAPIVIVHSENDPQLSMRDACALYHGLRRNNDNVYFIRKGGWRHLNIINDNDRCIKSILDKHNLLQENSEGGQDLSDYQPDPAMFETEYKDLKSKERRHTFVATGLLVSTLGGLYKIIQSYYS